VAYLEGWFVRAASRRQSVGRALIEAVEEWARHNGCTELASFRAFRASNDHLLDAAGL
jgi:GNAT superfamily N-acetyltransferase